MRLRICVARPIARGRKRFSVGPSSANDLLDPQVVAVELVVVLRVGDGGLEQLAPVARDVARRDGEDRARLFDGLAADVVADQARLARGRADVLRACARTTVAVAGLRLRLRGLGASSAGASALAWPRRAALRLLGGASSAPRPLGLVLGGVALLRGRLLRPQASSAARLLGAPASWPRAAASPRPRLAAAFFAAVACLRGPGVSPAPSSASRPWRLVGLDHRSFPVSAWPRYVRVGANSPSLWPTIDSRHEHGHVLAAVVDGDRVADHLGEDRRGRATRS